MKLKSILKQSTNRTEHNKVRKLYLESQCLIDCSRNQYNRKDNFKGKRYGNGSIEFYEKFDTLLIRQTGLRFPNWKLVSKNKKQWNTKPVKIVVNRRIEHRCAYVEILF